MLTIQYPPSVRAAARAHGVQLPESEEIEVLPAVVDMGADFGADFGFLKNFKASVQRATSAVKRNVLRPAGGTAPAVQAVGRTKVATAFAIRSPLMPASQALAAADRLLGDPKILNAQNIVRNTQALAALGDPAAKRGLVALQAAGNIRAATGAEPGKKAVNAKAPPARAVTVQRSQSQVRRAATRTAATVSSKRPNLFKRIMISLGFLKK